MNNLKDCREERKVAQRRMKKMYLKIKAMFYKLTELDIIKIFNTYGVVDLLCIGCYRHLTPRKNRDCKPNGVFKYEKKSRLPCREKRPYRGRDCMSIKTLNTTNTNSVGVQPGGLNSMQINLSFEHSQNITIREPW